MLKGRKIAKTEICDSFFKKLKGLMFRKRLGPGKCLFFVFDNESIIPIHMLFVFFKIDVLWLDRNLKVVDCRLGLRPFSFATPKKPARYIVEAAAGKFNSIRLGDIFELKT